MKLAVFAYTRAGCRTAGRVCRALPEAERCCYAPPRLEAPGFAALDAGVYGEAFAKQHGIAYTTRPCAYTPVASGSCGENAVWTCTPTVSCGSAAAEP